MLVVIGASVCDGTTWEIEATLVV